MLAALGGAVLGATVTFVLLMVVERVIHSLTHNHDRSYRWGVWLFAILAGLYIFITDLGRN